jgi:hypothetical protein
MNTIQIEDKLYHKTMDIHNKIENNKDTLTSDEIHTMIKPLAMELFEYFYDSKMAYDIHRFDDENTEPIEIAVNNLLGNLFHYSDRWSFIRLVTILTNI